MRKQQRGENGGDCGWRQLKTGRLHRAIGIMVVQELHPVTCGRVVHKQVDNRSYVADNGAHSVDIMWTGKLLELILRHLLRSAGARQ